MLIRRVGTERDLRTLQLGKKTTKQNKNKNKAIEKVKGGNRERQSRNNWRFQKQSSTLLLCLSKAKLAEVFLSVSLPLTLLYSFIQSLPKFQSIQKYYIKEMCIWLPPFHIAIYPYLNPFSQCLNTKTLPQKNSLSLSLVTCRQNPHVHGLCLS